jgi:hypothetical protein
VSSLVSKIKAVSVSQTADVSILKAEAYMLTWLLA